jgi:hypothetical protein
MRTDYLDATTGDIQLNLDWRAFCPRNCAMSKAQLIQ